MAHSRNRHLLSQFAKRLAFSRVLAIQGCRQSGKSFLAKHLLSQIAPEAQYVTFDQKTVKTFASENPESFLKQYQSSAPLIIDEAQKVPGIFDAIKFEVDEDPRPGQYVVLGSTEFSKLLKIRESLTGRMSRLRLFPLSLAESLEVPLSLAPLSHLMNSKLRANRSQMLKHLERGGFPGIFAVRDESARKEFFRDWLDLTLDRDIHQFPGVSVDTELAGEIIQQIVLLPEPNASNLAKATKKDTRKILQILRLLETLFVVQRLTPFKEGTGKPLFFLCDVGLAAYLGADFERKLWTWLLQEQLSQRNCRSDDGWRLHYYRSPKGKFLHLVAENLKEKKISALKIISTEQFDARDFEILKAFYTRTVQHYKKVSLVGWGPMSHGSWDGIIDLFPWEAVV